MTKEELHKWINQKKINTYNGMDTFMSGNINMAHTGYKSLGDLLTDYMKRSANEIEIEIRKYEKENP